MNIELAKSIAISDILGKLNLLPKSSSGKELRYLSPFRNERTPSFFVNVNENVWFDHGEGIGGDLIKFVCVYLERQNESHTVSDALRWLKNMSGMAPDIIPLPEPHALAFEQQDAKLVLKSKKQISHVALVRYLEKRGIPLTLANQCLKELCIYNNRTGRSFHALGFENMEGGFEFRNPMVKGCLRPKAITFIRGRIPKPEGIHLFEGFMDYLSAIAQRNGKRFRDDTIVLNSLSCMNKAKPFIHNYGYGMAYTWMDNDVAGQKATDVLAAFFKTEEALKHVPMNAVFAPHKDVNAWHMHKLGLVL